MNKQTTLNVRIGGALSDFVAANVGDDGSYENVSEYVRDLIRRDMETRAERFEQESILAGYRDLASGAIMPSTGDFHKDMKELAERETRSWL